MPLLRARSKVGLRLKGKGTRTASKWLQQELIRKAELLGTNIELILPECQSKCWLCPFSRTRRELTKIQRFKNDAKKLSSYAEAGTDQLARAYAATLLIGVQKRAPYLAVIRTPLGTIPFAIRGRVQRDKLIGVQHFDKPEFRLIAYRDLIKRHKLHLYSCKDKLICTGSKPKIPEIYLQECIEKLKYKLNVSKQGEYNVYYCNHLNAKIVAEDKSTPLLYLRLTLLSGNSIIGVCRHCIENNKAVSIYLSFIRNLGAVKPELDFELKLNYKPVCEGRRRRVGRCYCKMEHCIFDTYSELDTDLVTDYYKGVINSDYELINKHDSQFVTECEDKGLVLVRANVCFGANIEAFIKSLDADELEEQALKVVLNKLHNLLSIDANVTGSKLLSRFWKQYGKLILNSIVRNKKLAEELYTEFDINKYTVSQILHLAKNRTTKLEMLAQLPKYQQLPPELELADRLAKLYHTEGKEGVETELMRCGSKADEPRTNAVAYAFFCALDAGESQRWRYTDTELELGAFLKSYVQKLMEADAENYHDTFQSLSTALGLTIELKRRNNDDDDDSSSSSKAEK